MAKAWAFRRRFLYLGALILFLSVFGFWSISSLIKDLPSCQDGRQNGDETGIDCGGSCERACLYEVDQISVLWTRTFEVVPGRYNALAYLENHNPTSAVRKIKYRFRFADADNLYIGKKEGTVFIPPSGRFAVFEPGINFGNSIPIYTTFEFLETPDWVQVPEEKMREVKVLVSGSELLEETTTPRLFATVKNNSLFIIPEVDVVAILYDAFGNAVSVSRTYIEELDRGESKRVSFTWPKPFSTEIVAREIIPMYDLFSVRLK